MPERDKWLAWFEKQGELKPTDKIEPKFKVGNWYQCTKDFFGKGVTFDKNTAYYCAKEGCLQNEYGCHIAIVKDLYDNFKLWTIEDAKDGDVLASDVIESHPFPFVAIYKKQDDELFESYCFIGHDGKFYKGEIGHVNEYVHPATQEQRELLFRKMKEAGYEWYDKKKELKKIEDMMLEMRGNQVISEIIKNQKEMPGKFTKLVHENFWDLIKTDHKMLDADKVIEWLKTKVFDDSARDRACIDQFKKDFEL